MPSLSSNRFSNLQLQQQLRSSLRRNNQPQLDQLKHNLQPKPVLMRAKHQKRLQLLLKQTQSSQRSRHQQQWASSRLPLLQRTRRLSSSQLLLLKKPRAQRMQSQLPRRIPRLAKTRSQVMPRWMPRSKLPILKQRCKMPKQEELPLQRLVAPVKTPRMLLRTCSMQLQILCRSRAYKKKM